MPIALFWFVLCYTLRPRQNGRHVAGDIFKCIFLNDKVWIAIEISLKFVPKGSVKDIPALVQRMAQCRLGDKPLFEAMMVRLPTHMSANRPHWVNWFVWFYFCIFCIDFIYRHLSGSLCWHWINRRIALGIMGEISRYRPQLKCKQAQAMFIILGLYYGRQMWTNTAWQAQPVMYSI